MASPMTAATASSQGCPFADIAATKDALPFSSLPDRVSEDEARVPRPLPTAGQSHGVSRGETPAHSAPGASLAGPASTGPERSSPLLHTGVSPQPPPKSLQQSDRPPIREGAGQLIVISQHPSTSSMHEKDVCGTVPGLKLSFGDGDWDASGPTQDEKKVGLTLGDPQPQLLFSKRLDPGVKEGVHDLALLSHEGEAPHTRRSSPMRHTPAEDSSLQHVSVNMKHQRSRSIRSHASHGGLSSDTHTSQSSSTAATTRTASPFDGPAKGISQSQMRESSAVDRSLCPWPSGEGAAVHLSDAHAYIGRSALARSPSEVSTTPTSPETELNNSMSLPMSSNADFASAIQPHEDNANSAARAATEWQLADFEPSQKAAALSTLSPDQNGRATRERLGSDDTARAKMTKSSLARKGTRKQHKGADNSVNTRPLSATLVNRNKPLPVPEELTISDGPRQSKKKSTSATSGVQVRSSRATSQSARDMNEESKEPKYQRGTGMRSILSRSGMLFRSPTPSGARHVDDLSPSTLETALPSASSQVHEGDAAATTSDAVRTGRDLRGAASLDLHRTLMSTESLPADEKRSKSPFASLGRRSRLFTASRRASVAASNPLQNSSGLGPASWSSAASQTSVNSSRQSYATQLFPRRLSHRFSSRDHIVTPSEVPCAQSTPRNEPKELVTVRDSIATKPERPAFQRQRSRSVDTLANKFLREQNLSEAKLAPQARGSQPVRTSYFNSGSSVSPRTGKSLTRSTTSTLATHPPTKADLASQARRKADAAESRTTATLKKPAFAGDASNTKHDGTLTKADDEAHRKSEEKLCGDRSPDSATIPSPLAMSYKEAVAALDAGPTVDASNAADSFRVNCRRREPTADAESTEAWWGANTSIASSGERTKLSDAAGNDLSSLGAAQAAAALSSNRGEQWIQAMLSTYEGLSASSIDDSGLPPTPHEAPATGEAMAGSAFQSGEGIRVTRSEAMPPKGEEVFQHRNSIVRRKSTGVGWVLDTFSKRARPQPTLTDPFCHSERKNSSEELSQGPEAAKYAAGTEDAQNHGSDLTPSSRSAGRNQGMTESCSEPVLFQPGNQFANDDIQPGNQFVNDDHNWRPPLTKDASDALPPPTAYRGISNARSHAHGHKRAVSSSFARSAKRDGIYAFADDFPLICPSACNLNTKAIHHRSGEDTPRTSTQKPSLQVETRPRRPQIVKRPSSAMDFSTISKSSASSRQSERPSLSMADDGEFLQALEHVRRLNQERIQRQCEETLKSQQMSDSGAVLSSQSRSSQSMEDALITHDDSPNVSEERNLSFGSHQRSSSASGRFGSPRYSPCKSPRELDWSMNSLSSGSVSYPPRSALEKGVGKASGKLRDGAFINDEDWKKEVKALFIIREIVLTERSYACHLEALLQAVQKVYHASSLPRRTGTPSLMTTPTSSLRAQPNAPPHITTMRHLLPQMITTSRALANRIDDNPTAAGVGAAFRAVGEQIESTLIAWSEAAKGIHDSLRLSEGPKGKSRDRLGLIGVGARPSKQDVHTPSPTGSSAESGNNSEAVSPLTEGRTSLIKSNHVEMASYQQATRAAPQYSDLSGVTKEDSDHEIMPRPGKAKRRSTISALPPSLATTLRSKRSATLALSIEPNSQGDATDGPTSDILGSSAKESPTTANTVSAHKSRKNETNSLSSSLWRGMAHAGGIMTAKPEKGSENGILLDDLAGKKLSAMDIAIMPTQRIPRYLLLLRDLHSNTPPSSLSHARLQRSLELMQRVAASCDTASKSVTSAPRPVPSAAKSILSPTSSSKDRDPPMPPAAAAAASRARTFASMTARTKTAPALADSAKKADPDSPRAKPLPTYVT